MGETKQPVQMQLPFARPYSDIALKEAIRSVKTIAREMIRLGLDEDIICHNMQTLGRIKPIIAAAIDAMDEKILAAQGD